MTGILCLFQINKSIFQKSEDVFSDGTAKRRKNAFFRQILCQIRAWNKAKIAIFFCIDATAESDLRLFPDEGIAVRLF